MSTSPQLLLALDYGGTKHAAALLRVGERAWAAHARVQSPPGPDAAYDQATMRRMALGLLAQVPGRLRAIGVSFGGPVDATRGLVRLSHHVPGWEDIPLRDQLQVEYGVPAAVDNDANVAALGEWRFGAGRGSASLLYVTISTGIGGGWVLGGRIWGGADGVAGEIGHMIVRPGGAPCACGRRGRPDLALSLTIGMSGAAQETSRTRWPRCRLLSRASISRSRGALSTSSSGRNWSVDGPVVGRTFPDAAARRPSIADRRQILLNHRVPASSREAMSYRPPRRGGSYAVVLSRRDT